jgi:hypothetical protein
MKAKFSLRAIIILSFICTLSCKKRDYRDQYTGNYNFTVKEDIYTFGDSISSDTVYYYPGQIINGNSGDDINIYFLPDNFMYHSLYVKIDDHGNLHKPQMSGLGWGFTGSFTTNDKIVFVFDLANGLRDSVTGNKR